MKKMNREAQKQHFINCFTYLIQHNLDEIGELNEQNVMGIATNPLFLIVKNLPEREKSILYLNNKNLEILCEIKAPIETRD